MKKLRIGIEAQRLYREKKHGMDIYALQLVQHLQQVDHHNEYFVFVKPGKDICLEETDNFRIVEVRGLSYLDWEQLWLPLVAYRYKLDLLHCTSNTAPLLSPASIFITLHDIIYLNKTFAGGSWYQRLGHHYRRWIVPSAFRNARQVITVSEFEKGTITRRFGHTNKLHVTYNGVDKRFHKTTDSQILEEVRNRLKLPEAYMFFLGNTAPKKNMLNVLQGYALYCAENNNPLPLLVAESSEAELDKMLQRLGLTEIRQNIQLSGYVAHDTLPALYQLAKLFLYPSLRESFGIPIIEAMACGTPVITSDCTSMPEVAGGAALLVNPEEPESIAKAISEVTNHQQTEESLREKGLQRAQIFQWQRTAEETRKLYELTSQTHVKAS